MTTLWEIVSRVQNRVKDIPTEVGSAVIYQYAEDAAQDVQTITGNSISDLTAIGSTYVPAISNLAAVYILGYMSNVGVSYSAGRMSINKATEATGINNQLEYFMQLANNSIQMLGGARIEAGKTEPTT
jgi:hypothetical protein